MMIPRVIPLLLLSDSTFVKTIGYKKPNYIGDPVNTINLFNQFEVDEIVVLDIDASRTQKAPNFSLLLELAGECWTPLSYGGGIRTLEHMQKLFECGIEKIILGTIAYEKPEIVTEAVKEFGAQAIVLSLDIAKDWLGKYIVKTKANTIKVVGTPAEIAIRYQELGVGEILLNAIYKDGTMSGYDLELIKSITSRINIPVIASCGAKDRLELSKPCLEANASAVAAGSIFVYQGQNKSVLINFPKRKELEYLFKK